MRRDALSSAFTAENDEPNWQLAHDILAPAFTREAMSGYHPIMLEVARELLGRWDAAAERGESVDVSADTTRLTMETIGRAGFGYRFASFDNEQAHPFVLAMTGALRHSRISTVIPWAPVRRVLRSPESRYRADVATMERTVDEVIQARRDDAGSDASDLLGRMLRTAHPETGRLLDPVNIRHQLITFIVAGHETTSGALSFALYYLTRDPRALAQAQAEVDAL